MYVKARCVTVLDIQHFMWSAGDAQLLALIGFLLSHSESHIYCYITGPAGWVLSDCCCFTTVPRVSVCLGGLEAKVDMWC